MPKILKPCSLVPLHLWFVPCYLMDPLRFKSKPRNYEYFLDWKCCALRISKFPQWVLQLKFGSNLGNFVPKPQATNEFYIPTNLFSSSWRPRYSMVPICTNGLLAMFNQNHEGLLLLKYRPCLLESKVELIVTWYSWILLPIKVKAFVNRCHRASVKEKFIKSHYIGK